MKWSSRKIMVKVLAFFSLFILFGCSEPPSWTAQINAPKTGVKQADIVLVRSPAVLAMLSDVSASRWFAERENILTLWGDDLELERFELAANTRAIVVSYREASLKTVLIFENSDLGTTRREAAKI